MKVLDLACPADHPFEGWFDSEDDFQSQQAKGLIECPFCGSTAVLKRPSAPRLNFGRSPSDNRAAAVAPSHPAGSTVPDSPSAAAPSPEAAATMALMHEAWVRAVRHVVATTEDVGPQFAEEARRIHYGEAPERGIRGQASAEQRQALQDEGIDVVPLPMPKGMSGPLQ